MARLDWIIVASFLAVLTVAALYTRRYVKSVSAFLAADRCGGRYLISMANAMAGLGVITLVYWFEMYYEAGFTAYWWGSMTEPALIIIALSGWVVYRFRQTRAMTLAQFFEMRYSRNFRVFAGLVAYVSGVVNFGIFPAVGARFFIALCGLPQTLSLGGFEVQTFIILMAGLLSVSLVFTFLGGHVAVMVTDFLQGALANVVFAVVMIFLLLMFTSEQMSEALLRAPDHKSLVDPFDIGEQSHFDLWFYLISVIVVFYSVLGWQGTAAYNCCAKDAHEAKMAKILEGWRFRVLLLIAIVAPIAVYTMLHHPDFTEQAGQVNAALDSIEAPTAEQQATLRNQLRTPYALAVMLPTGLIGLFAASMLAAFISTHDTYLHSWGSIFVQDVVLPFRKRPFSPRQHLWLLRLSIFGVAIFIFVFSILYRPTQFVAMFLAVSGAVFVGGAGSVIIGGLYWSRGTTLGAWAAMITGMTLSMLGIVVKQFDEGQITATLGDATILSRIVLYIKNGITGQEMTFYAIISSITAYIVFSLLSPASACNMDRLLHRGAYAVEGEESVSFKDARTWLERLGVDREFTGWDRIVTLVSIGWPLAWTALFLAGTAWAIGIGISTEWWTKFWIAWMWVVLAAAILVTIWFTIGGAGDLRYLFARLKTTEIDPLDDGRVVTPIPGDRETGSPLTPEQPFVETDSALNSTKEP